MKVKVCGITTLAQLLELQVARADYAGLIFYEGSKRFATPHLQHQKTAIRNAAIKKIGVFVNADFQLIKEAIQDYGLHAVQLHGDETDEFCLELMGSVKVIKVFRISDDTDISHLTGPFQNVCDYFLFDTDTKAYGGSGKQFNWTLLKNASINKPFFLSGGIGPEDVEKLTAFRHPFYYGVDINSRFEKSPGMKDLSAVRQFIEQIKRNEPAGAQPNYL